MSKSPTYSHAAAVVEWYRTMTMSVCLSELSFGTVAEDTRGAECDPITLLQDMYLATDRQIVPPPHSVVNDFFPQLHRPPLHPELVKLQMF